MNQEVYECYRKILEEELVPAMGCTEPISIAYAGSIVRKILGQEPERVRLVVSGNIVKNVKSVIVPHTNGRKGLKTAVAAGICFGAADKGLEVLSDITKEQEKKLTQFLEETPMTVEESDANCVFDIQLTAEKERDSAYVRLLGDHTNVVLAKRNETVLYENPYRDQEGSGNLQKEKLTVKEILEFADQVEIEDVREVLDRQIACNMAIAKKGLEESYGAQIGRILLRSYGDSIHNRAKAYAAAGSDARMNGCELPVVINSGSGNQGITASVPVILYAKECGASRELLYRALVVSNLVTIHLKTGIGCLSAYCGATSAGCGAGAGICYLYGGREKEVSHTIVNALAINSGMICDGAKASCAAKIASAIEAGLLGLQMNLHDSQFYDGDGIVVKGVENTIRAVSAIAREGMRTTDEEIIRFMIKDPQKSAE